MEPAPTLSRRGFALLALGLSLAPALPAARLFDFAIAGGIFHGLRQRSVREALRPGIELHLRAEPDNRFDPNAVAVLNGEGLRLGYIPRARSAEVARHLAAGAALRLEVVGHLPDADDAGLVMTGFLAGDPRLRLWG